MIEIYKFLNKRLRFFILIFIIKKALNEHYIIILSNVELIISIKLINRLSSANILSLIVNRF